MDESTKSKQYWGSLEHGATRGKGIDIGCGRDPVTPGARRFDLEHGDANVVSRYVNEQFDFVYSSHCLEHMHDARAALLDWWKLVRPGGHLFVVVPDEDLYEQGIYPSRFNNDHKATFTLSKSSSWSPRSYNMLELAQSLPGGQLVSLQLQDRGYNRNLIGFGERKPGLFARLLANLDEVLGRLMDESRLQWLRRLLVYYYPVDQTAPPYNAQAQIQLIVKKVADTGKK